MSPRPGPIKHGTIYAYKARRCRCDACRTANREMCRARSAKKSKSAINYHLDRHGNLDRLGAKPGGPNNGQSKPVRIGGQEWSSQSALDRALGVPLGTVSRWIKAGQLDALTGAVMRMNTQRKAA